MSGRPIKRTLRRKRPRQAAKSNIAADYRARALSLGRAASSGGFEPP